MAEMASELVNTTCPSENKMDNDPSAFWDNGPHWDAHRIGWTVSGPEYQRHIIRIVLMVPIYAVVSWLSYRFFHYSIYYEAVRDCYEAFVIAAFFALLTQYVEDSPEDKKEMLDNAAKKKCPFPLGCYRYRPTSESFSHIVKWGILQYVALIPLITFAILITEAFGVYCAESMSLAFGRVYLKSAQIICVTIAMYALIVFYSAIKEAIASEQPFFKLLSVFLSFLATYGVIHESQYWTSSNISRGINSLLICCEMVIFAFLHVYAFPYKPFRDFGKNAKTSIFKGLIDAFNPIDMLKDFIIVTVKVWDIARQKRTKSFGKDRFSLYRAFTYKRKQHKYKNLDSETSSKNLDLETP
ncbi:8169_t:CDS:2 [Cetraspora pellucida]|uniref:8169_t:CDS:1 n=1 Tax=Cetraspora pellucida TaxID=1433469 RepID=A0A9N9N3R5_9GLOM|nr:8169_t:CDS:2 [Cetraspora pellucida]